MRVTISGRHMDVTPALKDHVESGLAKLKEHFDRVLDADVVLTVEKKRHIAEVNLHLNGVRIHGKEASPDMYASVDTVMTKLDRQIRKYKERIKKFEPRRLAEEEELAYHHQIIAPLEAEEGEAADWRRRVVKHEKVPMKPMAVDEAVMQLDLTDDPFLVFVNADSRQVNVLYRLNDGALGLIEPEY